jgi:hypothetical protein
VADSASTYAMVVYPLVHVYMCAGAIYKYDVSMPVPLMYRLVEDVRHRLNAAFPGMTAPGAEQGGGSGDDSIKVVGYGHLGMSASL